MGFKLNQLYHSLSFVHPVTTYIVLIELSLFLLAVLHTESHTLAPFLEWLPFIYLFVTTYGVFNCLLYWQIVTCYHKVTPNKHQLLGTHFGIDTHTFSFKQILHLTGQFSTSDPICVYIIQSYYLSLRYVIRFLELFTVNLQVRPSKYRLKQIPPCSLTCRCFTMQPQTPSLIFQALNPYPVCSIKHHLFLISKWIYLSVLTGKSYSFHCFPACFFSY